ncbi:MAG: 4-hydroxy-tetrahydrodipicolinate reductase [Firmicutes bacterium]|nr:4-hydroxy-tetrahydrodipicolinate reductase [Bacillota bacterium]
MIRVAVAGAAGRMGTEVVRAVWRAEDLMLVAALDVRRVNADAGVLAGLGEIGVPVRRDLEEVLDEVRPDVLVDFTAAAAAVQNARAALNRGVRPVVGTTGIPAADLEELARLSAARGVGAVVAPNFALGAVLMMRFAAEAARFFPHVEIIELHHDQKVDAPSGTALKTAEVLAAVRGDARRGMPAEELKLPGVRGGTYDGGIRIHSVRLPGLVAHQEVIFGGTGQTLTIRHDSTSRESFMPGVLLAVRKVVELKGLVHGLDRLLFEG